MFSCQRSRALLAAESNGLINRFGKYHSARPQPKGRAGEARRVPITVGKGAARRAGNRKGPALEEQARNWAKKKPLKFTRKIRGLSFGFGGAGGRRSCSFHSKKSLTNQILVWTLGFELPPFSSIACRPMTHGGCSQYGLLMLGMSLPYVRVNR